MHPYWELSGAELRRDEGLGNDACHPFHDNPEQAANPNGRRRWFHDRRVCIWAQPAFRQPSLNGIMALRLYDTLTRAKRDFVPVNPERVTMYVCGPTVYNYAHVGNARPVVVFDVLFRVLRRIYGAEH